MLDYPFNNSVSKILRDFNLGRIVALVLSAIHILLTCFQFSELAAGTPYWTYVHLVASLLVFVALYHVMFSKMPLKELEYAVTEKARYESVLYVLLSAVISESDNAVRERLLTAYIKRLRATDNINHQAHLEHQQTELKEEVLRVCQKLISDERDSLIQKIHDGLNGVTIQVEGEYISRLEAIASLLRKKALVKPEECRPVMQVVT